MASLRERSESALSDEQLSVAERSELIPLWKLVTKQMGNEFNWWVAEPAARATERGEMAELLDSVEKDLPGFRTWCLQSTVASENATSANVRFNLLSTFCEQIKLSASGLLLAAPAVAALRQRWEALGCALGGIEQAWLNRRAPSVHIVSASTTAATNRQLNGAQFRDRLDMPFIRFRTLAATDDKKLERLYKLFDKRSVVILSEASVFGAGVCPNSGVEPPKICRNATEIQFPANIADIRFGQSERRARLKQAAAKTLDVPLESRNLALEDGAENGSEFPESQRSPLSASSAEMELEQAIRQTKALNPHLIIVAATDVRDRLFLFDRLHTELPRTLLVDLEADVLMAHPDFIHASRGTLVMGSAALLQKNNDSINSFSNDDQASMYRLICNLNNSELTACKHDGASAEQTHLFIPTRMGLQNVREPEGFVSTCVSLVKILGSNLYRVLACGFAGAVLVLLLFTASRSRRGASKARQFLCSTILLSFAMLFLWFARWVWQAPQIVISPWELAPASGVSPAAALLVLVVALVVSFVAWAMTRAASKSARELSLPTNGMANQSIFAVPDVTTPAVKFVGFAALLIWLWLATAPFTTHQGPWFRVSLLSPAVEGSLYFAQLFVALTAIAGFVGAGAWVAAIGSSRERLESLIARYQVGPLLAWSVNPLFLLGTSASNNLGAPGPVEEAIDRLDLIGATWVGGQTALQPQRYGAPQPSDPLGVIRTLPRFASTPLLARSAEFEWLDTALRVPGESAELAKRVEQLQFGYFDTPAQRTLIALVLARMLEGARVSLYLGLAMSAALVALGYFYPVTASEHFVLFGLAMLVYGALVSGMLLFRLKRKALLDRLICDGDGKTDLDFQTVTAYITPVALVVIGWVVVEVPGVLDWSGGIFEGLLGVLK